MRVCCRSIARSWHCQPGINHKRWRCQGVIRSSHHQSIGCCQQMFFTLKNRTRWRVLFSLSADSCQNQFSICIALAVFESLPILLLPNLFRDKVWSNGKRAGKRCSFPGTWPTPHTFFFSLLFHLSLSPFFVGLSYYWFGTRWQGLSVCLQSGRHFSRTALKLWARGKQRIDEENRFEFNWFSFLV